MHSFIWPTRIRVPEAPILVSHNFTAAWWQKEYESMNKNSLGMVVKSKFAFLLIIYLWGLGPPPQAVDLIAINYQSLTHSLTDPLTIWRKTVLAKVPKIGSLGARSKILTPLLYAQLNIPSKIMELPHCFNRVVFVTSFDFAKNFCCGFFKDNKWFYILLWTFTILITLVTLEVETRWRKWKGQCQSIRIARWRRSRLPANHAVSTLEKLQTAFDLPATSVETDSAVFSKTCVVSSSCAYSVSCPLCWEKQ